ncbi:MAG: prolyl oligopeptidase family serine peptidase [Chloroflexota bacterium]|nr:prolyl oligopeptidase family serine peptidase [Chloroflexota bacterium]
MLDLLDRLAREAPPPIARIPYGDAPQQFGDLRLPSGATPAPYPVVIVIHGGYWRNRYDLAYYGAACGALADAGLASWNIEYRRIGDAGGAWPGTFADIAAAADALRTVATRYPLDLSHTLTLGHSAGGQLGLWLAGRPRIAAASPLWRADPLPIAGAVALAGVLDLRRAWELRLSENATEALLGATPADAPARYAAASPYDLAPLGVPQALFHGTADSSVPFELSQRYADHARALGDDVRLFTQAGADHFEAVDPATPEWRAVAAELLRLAGR